MGVLIFIEWCVGFECWFGKRALPSLTARDFFFLVDLGKSSAGRCFVRPASLLVGLD